MRGRLVAVLAALGLVAGGGALAGDWVLHPEPDGEVVALLLMGSDDGPPRGGNPLSARADAIQLLFVSGDRQHATFVSIPRDIWLTIPGRGNNRINACLNGGPERCVETVEAEFGIELDGYFVTSMDALKSAFNAFGRISVNVPVPVYDGGASIPRAGEQVLTGSQTLTYVRDRKNRSGGDFARSQAQAEVLALAHAALAEERSLPRVMNALAILRRHTVTDLPPGRLVRLAMEAANLPPENVTRVIVPARLGRAGAASVAFLNDGAHALVRDAYEDGRVGS